MERLTFIDHLGWYVNGNGGERIRGSHINRLAAYEDSGLEPEDLKKAFNETAHGVVKHTFAEEPAWMMHPYAEDDAGNVWYDGWGSSDETPFYKTREEAEAELAGKGGIHEADSV